jgi:Acyltransferase
VRTLVVFLFLSFLRTVAAILWPLDLGWVSPPESKKPWAGVRVVALLNHTSLFEWLFVGAMPLSALWRLAAHGVVPAAEKTLKRPWVGRFFKTVAAHVVSITRERDHTWRTVLARIDDPKSTILLAPEGRMKRRNGLDSNGQPMSVRGGIADILEAIPEGGLIIAYSGGLHHVQAPGERLPRPFRTIRMRLERLEIERYRSERLDEAGGTTQFKRAVVADLDRRRDLYCPPLESASAAERR